MPNNQDICDWMQAAGFTCFDARASHGEHRITADKAGLTLRATESRDLGWTISDATPVQLRPKGAYVTAQPGYKIANRAMFEEAIADIEATHRARQMLLEVARIALDPHDDRVTGHEEACCGVVLDSWRIDMSAFGFDFNDGGQWNVCGACGKRGRHYGAEGVKICVRGIDGAEPE